MIPSLKAHKKLVLLFISYYFINLYLEKKYIVKFLQTATESSFLQVDLLESRETDSGELAIVF